MTTLFTPFVTALVLSLVLAPLCGWLGRRHGCVAHPASDRWHRRTVPLLGGVAMFAAVMLGLLVLPASPFPAVLVGCAAVLFVLGLVDDLRDLSAATKLVAQFAVAAAFVFFEGGAGWTGWPAVDTVLAMLWIVGVTNAFNLIDNMDGLCAGVTLIAGVAWLGILSAAPGSAASADAWYLALLLGGVAGFLVYNRRPASIFMGDAGSLFLGSSVAVLTLGPAAGAFGQALSLQVALPLLVVLVPLLDTALVTCTRLLDARPVVDGGRDHTSHRLVAIGLSEGQAVAALWALAAAAGGAAWTLATVDGTWPVLLAAACALGTVVLGTCLSHVDVSAAFGDDGRRGLRPVPASSSPAGYAGAGRGAGVLLDFGLVAAAYYVAYRLRFERAAFDVNFGYFLQSLPIVVACQLVALWVAGAYRTQSWRFGVADAATLAKAAAGGTIAAQLVILYLYRFAGYSRIVFIYDGVLLLLALVATRVSFRLVDEHLRRRQRQGGERIVFYGAGEGDRAAFREFVEKFPGRYRVVGFIDDDTLRAEPFVPGHPVLGDRGRLLDLVRAHDVDAVAVGAAQAVPAVLDELRPVCETHDVHFFSIGVAPVNFRVAAGGGVAPRAVVTRNLRG